MIKRCKLNRIVSFSLALGVSFLFGSNSSVSVKGSSFVVNQMTGIPVYLNSVVSISPQFLAKTLELTIGNDLTKNLNVVVKNVNFNNSERKEINILKLKTKNILDNLEKNKEETF